MPNPCKLEAEIRSAIGSASSKRLRQSGRIPAILYEHGQASTPILLEEKSLTKVFSNKICHNQMVTLTLEGKKQMVIIKGFQMHPFKPQLLHVDLMVVHTNEPIQMEVPLNFIGEEKAPGVIKDKGILLHNLTQVQVKCLPDKLPTSIEVDVSQLALNQTLHLSELKLPEDVELVELSQGESHDLPIVSIHLPRASKIASDTENTQLDSETRATDTEDEDKQSQQESVKAAQADTVMQDSHGKKEVTVKRQGGQNPAHTKA